MRRPCRGRRCEGLGSGLGGSTGTSNGSYDKSCFSGSRVFLEMPLERLGACIPCAFVLCHRGPSLFSSSIENTFPRTARRARRVRLGAFRRDIVNLPSELCGRRSCTFTDMARLVPSGASVSGAARASPGSRPPLSPSSYISLRCITLHYLIL